MDSFNNNRRTFIKFLPSQLALTAGGVALSSNYAIASGIQNVVTVGSGGDFAEVRDALNSILDNSSSNPYLIDVLPGVYSSNWTTKDWVTVAGRGPVTTIFEGSNWGGIKIASSNIQLRDFGIRFLGSQQGHGAIRRAGLSSYVSLSGLHIDHAGNGSSIKTSGGDNKQTWFIENCVIRSEGIGLDVGGHNYIDNTKVFLYGDNSGHAHIGCRATGNSFRIYLNNCRIGSGYGYGFNGSFIPNEISGDDDVIGVWLPSGYSGGRAEIHGLESFCRNDTTVNQSVRVNVLRIESGWVRAFGSFGQAETPIDWSIRQTVYQENDGKLEQYACRFTKTVGNTFGSEVQGVQTYTASNDGYTFDKFEGGLHRLDATDGSFTLYLRHPTFATPGVTHTFKKVSDANDVFLDLNGATLEDNPQTVVLSAKYDELKITWDGTEWIRL